MSQDLGNVLDKQNRRHGENIKKELISGEKTLSQK